MDRHGTGCVVECLEESVVIRVLLCDLSERLGLIPIGDPVLHRQPGACP